MVDKKVRILLGISMLCFAVALFFLFATIIITLW